MNSKLLILLLDMAGVDGRTPHDDYKQLLKELELHNPEILEKSRLVVANKMDLPEARKNLAAFKRKLKVAQPSRLRKAKRPQAGTLTPPFKILEISALDGMGLEKLKLALRKALG